MPALTRKRQKPATLDSDGQTHARATRRRPPNPVVIKALRMQSGLIAPAAEMLQVDRRRLHEWIAADVELQTARDEVREVILDLAEGKLLQAVRDGSERSVHFLLKTIGKNRGFSERTEMVGNGGGPIQTEEVSPRERLARRLDGIATRAEQAEASS